MPDARVLYDTDFYSWTQEQAARLRAKAEILPNDQIDWAHVAEEIEDMGKEIAHAVGSAYEPIMEHLLKLEFSPAIDPRNGWRETVTEHRNRVVRRIASSPGLGPRLDELLVDGWAGARRTAGLALKQRDGLDPRILPTDCPYTRAQVEDFDWFPANRHGLE